MTRVTMKISGMHCDGCAERVEKVLGDEPGVRSVAVSFPRGEAEVRYDSTVIEEVRLTEVVERAGFGAERVAGARGRRDRTGPRPPP